MSIFDVGKRYRFRYLQEEWDKNTYDMINNREEEVTLDSNELLDAILTCGMPMYYLKSSRSMIDRLNELSFKLSIIDMALTVDSNDYLCLKEENLKYLDSSEKNVVSYYVGMFFTKLISKKFFDQQYLLHLSIAEKSTSICYTPKDTKSRPDFIGYNLDSGKFSVFESKGRKNHVKSTLKKAVDQVLSVRLICGDQPQFAVANMTYFHEGILHSKAVDPPSESGLEIEIEEPVFFKLYYTPIIELMQAAFFEEQEDKVISNIDLKDYKIEIIAPTYIFKKIQQKEITSELIMKYQANLDKKSDLINVEIK